MKRAGRRPGAPATRDAIVAVARRAFATHGYEATTLRAIAREAGVDPALLIHYFGSKDRLFAIATGLPSGLPLLLQAVAGLPDADFAEALVRAYLGVVDSDRSRNSILALVRSAVSHEQAAATLREFVTAQLLPVIAGRSDHPDARLRACLVAAQLVGIAMLRHVVRAEPLASAGPDEIAALTAPGIKRHLR